MAKNISQQVLANVLKKRAAIEKAQQQLKEIESALFDSLKNGAAVAPGLFLAEIKSFERRNVAWKPAFIEQIDKREGEGAGEALAARISAATKPSTYENLVVRVQG